MDLRTQNIFISGGSSGIGLAAARLFAQRGANVLIFARDERKLRDAERSLQQDAAAAGGRIAALSVDVTDPVACERELGDACREFGAPYVVINSAGVGGARAFTDETFARFDQRIKTNLYGVRNVCAAVVPSMKAAGGHIANVSSLAGLIGVFGFTSYAASKFAVIGFSEALRSELKPLGISVSVFCPPDVDTPMLQAENVDKPIETKAISEGGGLMSAGDAALALLQAIEGKRFMNLPDRQSRFVHLVNRWAPGLRERIVDRIIAKARR